MTRQSLLGLLLVLVGTLHGQEGLSVEVLRQVQQICGVPQPLRYAVVPEGGSVSITCHTSRDSRGTYLRKCCQDGDGSLLYFEDGSDPTVNKSFEGRIDFSGVHSNLTVRMRLLRREDSGVYVCVGVTNEDVYSSATMVVVTESSPRAHRSQASPLTSTTLPAALAVGFFLVGLILGALCMLRKTQMEKLCALKKDSPCVVYEDMSYGRRNTNLYQ